MIIIDEIAHGIYVVYEVTFGEAAGCLGWILGILLIGAILFSLAAVIMLPFSAYDNWLGNDAKEYKQIIAYPGEKWSSSRVLSNLDFEKAGGITQSVKKRKYDSHIYSSEVDWSVGNIKLHREYPYIKLANGGQGDRVSIQYFIARKHYYDIWQHKEHPDYLTRFDLRKNDPQYRWYAREWNWEIIHYQEKPKAVINITPINNYTYTRQMERMNNNISEGCDPGSFVHSCQLSPDGRWFVFITRGPEKNEFKIPGILWVVKVSDTPQQPEPIAFVTWYQSCVWWSDDGKKIVYVSSDTDLPYVDHPHYRVLSHDDLVASKTFNVNYINWSSAKYEPWNPWKKPLFN